MTRLLFALSLMFMVATSWLAISPCFAQVIPTEDHSKEVRTHWSEALRLGLAREREDHVLSSGLQEKMNRTPEAPVTVWVFLTDKGIGTPETLTRELQRVGEGLSERVRARRAGGTGNLNLQFTDLPVFEPYVSRLRGEGYRVRRVSRWLNAVSLEVPAHGLEDLGRLGFVRYVQPILIKRDPLGPEIAGEHARPERQLTPQSGGLVIADVLEIELYGSSFNQLDEIQVLDLHRMGYTGAGVRVMMLDTGFRKDHPVFGCTNLIAEWDFVNEDGNTQNELGDNVVSHNHGTGTWAVLGGYAPGSLLGPAFGAEFVLAKTEDVSQEVRAEEDNYVAALEWADTLGVDVTSASLAYFGFDDGSGYTISDLDGDTAVITVAVDIAVSKGMICVNSMGNQGPGVSSIWTPADADSVIAVGAVDSCGTVASFSSRGPTADNRIKPEVSARGVATYWARAASLSYGPASGTSLSAPLIGGLAALLKEAHPTWNGVDVREAMIGTASAALNPDNNIGYGIARGTDALVFGGATPEPPRMTHRFHLIDPPDSAVVFTVTPTLVWSASLGGTPDDTASYRILMDTDPGFPSPDTLDAGRDTTFVPDQLVPGVNRWWKVEAVGQEGYVRKSMNTQLFTVDVALDVPPGIPSPSAAFLAPAFPNPMRRSATLAFRAADGDPISLEILSVEGKLIRRFVAEATGEEEHILWDGRDSRGRAMPTGMYFYRLITPTQRFTRRLVRIP